MSDNLTFLKSLQNTLHTVFEKDETVLIFGEDLIDPYGGAFKVTKGLSTKFPDRVLSTPISESSFVGIASGLAMRGFRPLVEIMFGDFLTLCADQIINHATKFSMMYASEWKIPLVIRTPIGGGRGYGPTHSQSLEKHFLGTPNLTIIAPSHFHNPGDELRKSIYHDAPVLFLENKLLYPKKLFKDSNGIRSELIEKEEFSTMLIKNFEEDQVPDLIIIAYGGMSLLIESSMREMIEEEIRIEAIFPSCISDPPIDLICEKVSKSHRVLIIEEATAKFGWSSEISKEINENCFGKLDCPVFCLTNEAKVIPANSILEEEVMVNKKKIENTIYEVLSWS